MEDLPIEPQMEDLPKESQIDLEEIQYIKDVCLQTAVEAYQTGNAKLFDAAVRQYRRAQLEMSGADEYELGMDEAVWRLEDGDPEAVGQVERHGLFEYLISSALGESIE